MTEVTVTMPDHAGFLRVTMPLPHCSPAQVVAAFTDPGHVRRWWGGAELTIDPAPGGRYVAHFGGLGQTMRGSVVRIDPAGSFVFTWTWDHEPDLPPRRVEVTTDGKTLQLIHGPYDGSAADRADAESHRQGWQFFLPRLAALLATE